MFLNLESYVMHIIYKVNHFLLNKNPFVHYTDLNQPWNHVAACSWPYWRSADKLHHHWQHPLEKKFKMQLWKLSVLTEEVKFCQCNNIVIHLKLQYLHYLGALLGKVCSSQSLELCKNWVLQPLDLLLLLWYPI